MKTYTGDTVLYKLRVSSLSPSPDTLNLAARGDRTHRHKISVYNGVSANSWLLPIGICQRDSLISNQSFTHKNRAKSEIQASKTETLESDLDQEKTSDENPKIEDNETDSDRGESLKTENKISDKTTNSKVETTSNTYPMTSEEFDSLWDRVPQRPQHTGNVFIVRRRNVPEGIGKNEFLQGKHLRSKFEDSEECEQKTAIRIHPRPFTAPGNRQVRSLGENVTCTKTQRPFSHTGVRRGRSSLEKTVLNSVPLNSSHDLVVTSLTLRTASYSCPSAQSEDCPKHNDHELTDMTPSRPKTASASACKIRRQDQTLDTVDGIKRDFMRRAKSAPPKVRSLNTSSSCGPQCEVARPSLYWRARSAYHKKLMTYGPDQVEESHDQTHNIRGSLWRPLMVGEDGAVMQHSAGCPYKCKGCFKACLVSEDYLHKARAAQQKTLRESTQTDRQTRIVAPHGRPTSVCSKYRHKVKDPQNIVSIALAKSQPLYQLVHGQKCSKEKEGNLSVSKDEKCADENKTKNECVSDQPCVLTEKASAANLSPED